MSAECTICGYPLCQLTDCPHADQPHHDTQEYSPANEDCGGRPRPGEEISFEAAYMDE